MSKDRDIEHAIAAGERNKKTTELIHNWCVHARVEKFGGVGLIEAQTGLPIGHHSMACDHAPVAGMATWDLADAALDFHDRNCVGCDKRKILRLPNLSALVAQRDNHQERAKAEHEQLAKKEADAFTLRQRARDALRPGLAPASLTLLDDLRRLDTERSDEASLQIVEAAKLAPEVFTSAVIAHFFCLLESREHWFIETGLQALRLLRSDWTRVVKCAMYNLANHETVDISATIVEEHLDQVDKVHVQAAVPSLILLANPPRSPFDNGNRVQRAAPLLAMFRLWPEQVAAGVEELLADQQPFRVRTGAGALAVLASTDPTSPLRFARSLAAKLARVHLLLDDDGSSQGLDEVIHDLQEALALVVFSAPEQADAIMFSYYEGASNDGETRLLGTYRQVFAQARKSPPASNAPAYAVALRRLVWAATTSSNEDVLMVVQNAFHSLPVDLEDIVRNQLDVVLGAAALMDDRLTQFDASKSDSEPENFMEILDRQNRRRTLYQLRESFVRWVACAAKDHKSSTMAFVQFLGRGESQRDGLRSALMAEAHLLMETAYGLNAVLPFLYSALVGTSNLLRAAAARALSHLARRRVEDLPNLVFEAFVPLLRDRYVIVHQAAVEALDRIELPANFDAEMQSAVAQLIHVYRTDKESEEFLMKCIALYVRRYLDDATLKMGQGRILMAILVDMRPTTVVREVRFLGKRFASIPGYVDLVLGAFGNHEAMSYLEEKIAELLYEVPAEEAFSHRQRLEAAALSRSDNRLIAGSFVEVLTRAGAWQEAVNVAKASWDHVPDNTRMRYIKWSAELDFVATSYEAAIARGRMDALPELGQRWRKIDAAMQKDREENAERRDPLRGILRTHPGR